MTPSTAPMRLVVLISGSGTNLQALLDDQVGYEVIAVIADRSDALGIQRALVAGVATACIPLHRPRDAYERRNWERIVADVIDVFQPELIVMAGWMRIMSSAFVARFAGMIINQHPALLSADGGNTVRLADGRTIPVIRGAHAVRDALRLGVSVTGCTIHRVTPIVDAGPVLGHQEVPVLPDDTEDSLHERIKAVERQLIVAVVRQIAAARS